MATASSQVRGGSSCGLFFPLLFKLEPDTYYNFIQARLDKKPFPRPSSKFPTIPVTALPLASEVACQH